MSLFDDMKRIFYCAYLLGVGLIAVSVCIGLYNCWPVRKPLIKWESDESRYPELKQLAEPDELPYLVSIYSKIRDERHRCSGALVDPKHVLTVANCLVGYKEDNIRVFVGSIIVPGGTTYDVATITLHPNFNHTTMIFPVAVIRLEQAVTQSDYIKIINLPNQKQMMKYKQILFIGAFHKRGKFSKWADLRKYIRYVHHQNNCNRHIRKTEWDLTGKFCTFSDTGSDRFISNNIMGGIVTIDKKYIIGLYPGSVSHDTGERDPKIMIDVSSYLDFIRKQMSTN